MVSKKPPLGKMRRIASRNAIRSFLNLDTLLSLMLIAGDSVRVVGDRRELGDNAGACGRLDLETGLDGQVGIEAEGANFLPRAAVWGRKENVDVAAFGDAQVDGVRFKFRRVPGVGGSFGHDCGDGGNAVRRPFEGEFGPVMIVGPENEGAGIVFGCKVDGDLRGEDVVGSRGEEKNRAGGGDGAAGGLDEPIGFGRGGDGEDVGGLVVSRGCGRVPPGEWGGEGWDGYRGLREGGDENCDEAG